MGQVMDVYGLLEKEDRRVNRGACPVCNAEMPLVDIESHVNRCLDTALEHEDETIARSLARTGHHPLSTSPSSADIPTTDAAAGRKPPSGFDGIMYPKHSSFSAEDHAYASLLLQEMDAKNDGEELSDTDLRGSDTQDVPIFATKPGGYAVDMTEISRLSAPNTSSSPKRENQRPNGLVSEHKDKGKEKETDARNHKNKDKRRILAESDDSDIDDEGGEAYNDDDDELALVQAKLETMNKAQLKKLCLRQHRKIQEIKFRIKILEKDLKEVRVKQALNDDYQQEARRELREEYELLQRKTKEREDEHRQREEQEAEAKELAAALEAIRRREELEKAEADAAAAIEAALNEPCFPPLASESTEKVPTHVWLDTGIDGNGLFTLPEEVMVDILSRLNATDLASVMQTCKSLTDSAKDPILWRQLFVDWVKTAKSASWGEVDDATILQRFRPNVPTKEAADGADADVEKLWYSEFKKRYEKWRYGTITGNHETWKWDRRQRMLSGFSFSTRTHQRWTFDGTNLKVLTGLIGHANLTWRGDTLGIAFRPQKSFRCTASLGIQDTFWNQYLWRFGKKELDQSASEAAAGGTAPLPEPEDHWVLATRVTMGGPTPMRGPYRAQGDVPMPIFALVLLQASGHLS